MIQNFWIKSTTQTVWLIRYESYDHQINVIVTGSDVIIDDVTRWWDYRRERPDFRVPFAQFLWRSYLSESPKRTRWNFMWLYLILLTSNDLPWPHVTSNEVCKSLAKYEWSCNWESVCNSGPSIRTKTSLIEIKLTEVIIKSSDWMKFWPMRVWLEWNLIHRF